jgi:hypothetical protein
VAHEAAAARGSGHVEKAGCRAGGRRRDEAVDEGMGGDE